MSFESDVRKFAERTGRSLEQTVRAVCLTLTKQVVQATPVGNPRLWRDPESAPPGYVGGRLRGNWFATVGTPSDDATDSIDESGGRTIAAAGSAIRQAPGKQWWLTNNLPYSLAVEFGHSTQAPGGMVRIAAENMEKNVRDAARENEPKP